MIENHYPTMELEEIKKITFPSQKNSVLFLWVTTPKLTEGLELMKHWGFNYRTNLVWDKMIIGTGIWFRGQHELLLVGTKGNFHPPTPSSLVSSVFRRKRTIHSQKPSAIRSMIGKWYPKMTKLELFAREHVDGWDCFGNEVPTSTQMLLPIPRKEIMQPCLINC